MAVWLVAACHIKYPSVSGGAAVSPETVRYFLSLDMKLLEMTAMTETSGMVQITNRLIIGVTKTLDAITVTNTGLHKNCHHRRRHCHTTCLENTEQGGARQLQDRASGKSS